MNYKQRIDELRCARGLSINKVAALGGLSESCLKKILRGETGDPRSSTVEKICKGLGISRAEFYCGDDEIVLKGFPNLSTESAKHFAVFLSKFEKDIRDGVK